MRNIIWGLVICACLLFVGGFKTADYFRNLQPTTMSLVEFSQKAPSTKWVNLTGCRFDFEHAISLESKVLKQDKGVILPVHPVGTPMTGDASIALYTTTEQATQLLTARLENLADPNYAALVEGMVLGEFDKERDRVRKLVKGEPGFATTVIVIKHGAKPDPADVALFAGAVVGSGVLLFVLRRKRAKSALLPAPPPLPASGPPPLP